MQAIAMIVAASPQYPIATAVLCQPQVTKAKAPPVTSSTTM